MDPVSDIVDANPTSAVIATPALADADYQPGADNPPGADQTTGLVGAWFHQTAGDNKRGRFLIKAAARPAHMKEGVSQLVISADEVYQITGIRTRRWEGEINGYLLELGA